MSEWTDFKEDAQKEWDKARKAEQEAVDKVVEEIRDLSDKANSAAIKARPEGTPKIHPDRQDSFRPAEPVTLGAQPVGPGAVDNSIQASPPAGPEESVAPVTDHPGAVTVDEPNRAEALEDSANAEPGTSATGVTPVASAPDSTPQPGTPNEGGTDQTDGLFESLVPSTADQEKKDEEEKEEEKADDDADDKTVSGTFTLDHEASDDDSPTELPAEHV